MKGHVIKIVRDQPKSELEASARNSTFCSRELEIGLPSFRRNLFIQLQKYKLYKIPKDNRICQFSHLITIGEEVLDDLQGFVVDHLDNHSCF